MIVTAFWGGQDAGPCYQITARQLDSGDGYVQVTSDQARKVATTLLNDLDRRDRRERGH